MKVKEVMVRDAFPVHAGQTWSQKVFEADSIWAQVQKILENSGRALPKTPRRPDVRLIVDNKTGAEIQFLNPGDHSAEKPEIIPGSGEKTATMVMLGGDTLEDQLRNAQDLDAKYHLSSRGLTKEFAIALSAEAEAGIVLEAYGPAPFSGQAAKLEPLKWGDSEIDAVVDGSVAYGARPPEMETVMRSELAIFVKGTGTTPEQMDIEGICVAVASDWQTGAISTRPIAPSVAKGFYGEHYAGIPVVELDVDGNVASIDLKDGAPAIVLSEPLDLDAPGADYGGADIGSPP